MRCDLFDSSKQSTKSDVSSDNTIIWIPLSRLLAALRVRQTTVTGSQTPPSKTTWTLVTFPDPKALSHLAGSIIKPWPQDPPSSSLCIDSLYSRGVEVEVSAGLGECYRSIPNAAARICMLLALPRSPLWILAQQNWEASNPWSWAQLGAAGLQGLTGRTRDVL